MSRSSVPFRHRASLLLYYSGRLLRYNALLSLLGAVAVGLVMAAGLFAGVEPGSVSACPVRFTVVLFGVLLLSAGHWLAVLVMSYLHAPERPFYEAGGWRTPWLAFVSWGFSGVVGATVIVVGPLATGLVGYA